MNWLALAQYPSGLGQVGTESESNSFKELFMRKPSDPGQINSFWKPYEQSQSA